MIRSDYAQPQLVAKMSFKLPWAISHSVRATSLIYSTRTLSEEVQDNTTDSSSFLRDQYHHLPILNTLIPITTLQNEIPLLFWTIVVVSTMYHPVYHHVLSSLDGPYHLLLGKALSTSPMSLSTIQAILLLCFWPFPCRKQPQDPSWNLCGIAINASIQRGLHSPRHDQWAKISAEERDARSKTWLACFYISTS